MTFKPLNENDTVNTRTLLHEAIPLTGAIVSGTYGANNIRVTENAQFTEYPEGGFYDWHMDCDVNMQHEPPVRKISMTLLLNDPSEFEGGDLELMAPGKFATLKQGHAIVFASFLNHRVNPVKRGVRQSLVVWFGGKPFR